MGKPGQEVSVQVPNYTKIATLHSSLARINEEADPIGFLIAAANGGLFPVHYVVEVDGEMVVQTEYQAFNLKQRESIHRFFANKLVPTISLSKVIQPRNAAEAAEGEVNADPAEMSFLNMVRNAAGKAKKNPGIPAIPDAEIVPDQEFSEIIGE